MEGYLGRRSWTRMNQSTEQCLQAFSFLSSKETLAEVLVEKHGSWLQIKRSRNEVVKAGNVNMQRA